jgi:hypothetical protein
MNEAAKASPIDASLLDSAASCFDSETVRALSELALEGSVRDRLEFLASKANEGTLDPEESQEYRRFIELEDILATLRLKAERRLRA